MAISPSSPITGGAQTGFTSPTYTVSADVAPTSLGKQHAVTAIGGTQTGVTVSSVSSPFTVNFVRPATFKQVPPVGVNGRFVGTVPRNNWQIIARKGVTPLANQPIEVATCRVLLDVPAGADVADPANVRALLSLIIGYLSQLSAGFGDTAVSGIV